MLLDKKNLYLLTLFAYWVILWVSINTTPHIQGLFYIDNSWDFTEVVRISIALVSTLIIVGFCFFYISLKKIKIDKIYLYFFLNFVSHLVGLYLNENRIFNFNNSFLPLLAIGTILLFILCEQLEVGILIKYFFWISIMFLLISFAVNFFPKIQDLNNLNFSQLFSKNETNIFSLSMPRTSGLSRSLAIINLFLILMFLEFKKKYAKNFMIVITLAISLIIIFFQSRGTLLCYFLSLSIFIIFLREDKKNLKIKNILLLIIIPVFLYLSINHYFNNSKIDRKNIKSNNRVFNVHTSGRIETWAHVLKNYDYKKIFGYGAQGDRFFLKTFEKQTSEKGYGNNSSNIFIYTLLSGGIISFILLILIFYEILKILIKKKLSILFNRSSIYFKFSIICLIFFSIRSLVENSFGLFSIDFLIISLSIFCIISNTKVINK